MGTNYTVTEMKAGKQMDMWDLTPKVGNAEEGSVQFWEGRLSNVTKVLGKMDGDLAARTLGGFFYAVKREATTREAAIDSGGDWSLVRIEAATRDVSGVRMGDGAQEWRLRIVNFHLGEKTIDIWIVEPIGSPQGRVSWVQVSEHLAKGAKRENVPK